MWSRGRIYPENLTAPLSDTPNWSHRQSVLVKAAGAEVKGPQLLGHLFHPPLEGMRDPVS